MKVVCSMKNMACEEFLEMVMQLQSLKNKSDCSYLIFIALPTYHILPTPLQNRTNLAYTPCFFNFSMFKYLIHLQVFWCSNNYIMSGLLKWVKSWINICISGVRTWPNKPRMSCNFCMSVCVFKIITCCWPMMRGVVEL